MLLIAIGAFATQNIYLAGLMAIATVVIIYLNWLKESGRRKRISDYLETIADNLEESANKAILNLPIAMVITEANGDIIWYNHAMTEVIEGVELFESNIADFLQGFSLEKNSAATEQSYRIGDKLYTIIPQQIQTEQSKQRVLYNLYFQDVTAYQNLKSMYNDKRSIVALLQVDNYEDLLNETKEDRRPFLVSEIDKKISLWASRMNSLLKKTEKDKYVVVFEHKYLSILEAKRFVLLDEIREIDQGNRIPPTLSIGVATSGYGLSNTEENAFSALELALGRGGDQAVVRKSGDFEFYGGKSKAVEKRNKVKARIIAHALRPIVDESSKIYIMGHKFPDMDAFGAAIGIYRAVLNRGKEAFIVLEEVNESIKSVHAKFEDDSVYRFIQPSEAIANFQPQDLLIVVDTHRPNFTESPDLVALAQRKVLFDHHRRGREFIDDTLLTYLEPYASSTSELVTEVLQYMERKTTLEKKEAEALLAGIVVDTKNFSVKTGVRTFESAAVLRRYDADTTEVKNLFQDELETFVAKSNIVSNAETIGHSIALSVNDDNIKNARLVAAQGADSLLNIKGVKGAFVIAKENEVIYVSARSLGDINIQVIAEKLGGGGHLTSAGAQFTGLDIHQVKQIVVKAIDDYYKEVAKWK